MKKCNIVSASEANSLFWLGRYVERGYISLHLLRRYYDNMIDDHTDAYEEYYKKLDGYNPYTDAQSFRIGCLYDRNNPCSIITALLQANDNGILVRKEISTETLSYVQLSLAHIKAAEQNQETNITQLQLITDYLLAFWGSIDERVFDENIRNFLRIGRLIENIDMHIRFEYAFYRVREAFDSLLLRVEKNGAIFDHIVLAQLNQLLTEEAFDLSNIEYKQKLIKYMNSLVLV
ncbi:MAG: alpha-E domain-containing protein [Rikenellaceae bacterium]